MVNEVRARLADEQLHGVIGANNSLAEAGRTPTKSMVIGTPADRLLGMCVCRAQRGGRGASFGVAMTRRIAMAVSQDRLRVALSSDKPLHHRGL